MPTVRNKKQARYFTDGGTPYRYSVDGNRFLQGDFAWTAVTGAERARMPRGFTPRHVTGLSATTGFRGTAVVPDIGAPLWTGAATTFNIEAEDGSTDAMTVVNLIGEKPSLP